MLQYDLDLISRVNSNGLNLLDAGYFASKISTDNLENLDGTKIKKAIKLRSAIAEYTHYQLQIKDRFSSLADVSTLPPSGCYLVSYPTPGLHL